MTDFVTALTGTNGITSANVWSELSTAAPIITAMFLLAVGVYVVRRAIKKGSKLKGGF